MPVNPIITALGEDAQAYALYFTSSNRTEWDSMCTTLQTSLTAQFETTADKVRVFVLDCNTGSQDTTELWPVVAKCDNKKIPDAENPISRPELLGASRQTLAEYKDENAPAFVAFRLSTTTGTLNYYGTGQIMNDNETVAYILKLAISE